MLIWLHFNTSAGRLAVDTQPLFELGGVRCHANYPQTLLTYRRRQAEGSSYRLNQPYLFNDCGAECQCRRLCSRKQYITQRKAKEMRVYFLLKHKLR